LHRADVASVGALAVMSLTKAQAKKFNELVDGTGSYDQMTRIRSRLALEKFVREHGKEACDEEFAAENERRAKAKRKTRKTDKRQNPGAREIRRH
jgi:hypothetical protein